MRYDWSWLSYLFLTIDRQEVGRLVADRCLGHNSIMHISSVVKFNLESRVGSDP